MTREATDARVEQYRRAAEQMRAAADRAFDPRIAAEYRALEAKWRRLAEQVGDSSVSIMSWLGKAPQPAKPGR